MKTLLKFVSDQLSVWPLASANFRSLKTAKVKKIKVFGIEARAQQNPCRIISSTAEVDKASIAARPCFLCPKNRPAEQFHLKFEGRKGRNYNIQVNPYPIFPNHLVIARDSHIPQAIWHHFPDMLLFSKTYPDFLVFYNGPTSGASAPDHLHFQACPRHCMPLEEAVDAFLDNPGKPMAKVRDASLYKFEDYTRGVFALKAATPKSMAKLFYRLLECCDKQPGDVEPRFNLFSYVKDDEYRAFVVLRSEIRSHHYYSEGEDHLTMSPGAADMAAFFVVPKAEDYPKLDTRILEEMLSEVTISEEQEEMICWRLTRTQPRVEVGIMSAPEIVFEIVSDGAGPQKVSWCDGRINYNGSLYDELCFDAVTRSTRFAEPSFILHDVTIGINFHWEQKRTLQYAGRLKFIVEGDRITAVNIVGVEDYLLSVISSEMKSSASLELLKAHAVISRSWVLSRISDRAAAMENRIVAVAHGKPQAERSAAIENHIVAVAHGKPQAERSAAIENHIVAVAHGNYDVCADDHCQRYQGVAMAAGETVRKAIDETWGEVLRYDGEVCDTRYSKCCGGRTERFSACWEDVDFPYLQPVDDNDGGRDFCDCEDDAVLEQVLNDYDLKTRDFYRWTVRRTGTEFAELVRKKTGRDLGVITDMKPLERGESGRIIRMELTGTKGGLTVGKELEIRRVLSDSHLKSSAFEIRKDGDAFVLEGRGWGHGVGLCQIGAAVMASKGYGYKEILEHYYKGATVEQ